MKTTPQQPAVQPKVAEAGYTLLEAIGVLEYLQKRRLLCTGCGFKQVELENQYHSHCKTCARPGMLYNPPTTKASSLDKVLCERIERWADQTVTAAAQ